MVEAERHPRSIAVDTRGYIDEHPSIRDALRDDLVNFTALARKIRTEGTARNEEAVTIAARRYQRELLQETTGERAVRELLSQSRLEVRSRVGLVRLKDDWRSLEPLLALGRTVGTTLERGPVFHIGQGTGAITVLCEEQFLPRLLEIVPAPAVLAVDRGLSSLAFRSPPKVEETPGVLAYLAEGLFRAGVNAREIVSVHTHSIFVFRDRDVIRGYAALTALIPIVRRNGAPPVKRGRVRRSR